MRFWYQCLNCTANWESTNQDAMMVVREVRARCPNCACHMTAGGILGRLSLKLVNNGVIGSALAGLIRHMAGNTVGLAVAPVFVAVFNDVFGFDASLLQSFDKELTDMTVNALSIGLQCSSVVSSRDNAWAV